MTAVWLLVWLLSPGNDPIYFATANGGGPNSWGTWLLICVALDLAGGAAR